jgi:hypothetical protein
MFRITSFPTPVSPVSAVISRDQNSALTPPNNNSIASVSNVTFQRQGAQIGNPERRIAPEAISFFRSESHLMLYRLFKFMGEGLPLTSKGVFELDHVIEEARRKAENLKKSNPTVSQLWNAVATLINPKINKNLGVVINKNTTGISITGNHGFADFLQFQNSNFYKPQNYPGISVENYYTYSAFKRGAKRAEHLKRLNSLNCLLSDYQAYLDSLKTESPLS